MSCSFAYEVIDLVSDEDSMDGSSRSVGLDVVRMPSGFKSQRQAQVSHDGFSRRLSSDSESGNESSWTGAGAGGDDRGSARTLVPTPTPTPQYITLPDDEDGDDESDEGDEVDVQDFDDYDSHKEWLWDCAQRWEMHLEDRDDASASDTSQRSQSLDDTGYVSSASTLLLDSSSDDGDDI